MTASQTFCFALALMPCLAFTAAGLPRLDLSAVAASEGDVSWAPLAALGAGASKGGERRLFTARRL